MKKLETAYTQIKNEYDLLKLKYENSECNYNKKNFDLEENKKKLHEIQSNFDFYNEKSICNKIKLTKNEKEKIEIMTKENEKLKSENKNLMESNMNFKEEIKKLFESKNLEYANAKINKGFGQAEQMGILLKEYKEQMKVKCFLIFIFPDKHYNIKNCISKINTYLYSKNLRNMKRN